MLPKIVLTAALAASSQAVFAQQVLPNAGSQLQQIPPAPMPERAAPDLELHRQAPPIAEDTSGARIRVIALHLTGQTLYSEADLIAASGFTPGHEMTLGELRAVAHRIATFYNAHGYFLTQTYLPAQDVQSGTITIAVVEGRYGKVDVRNQSHLSTARAQQILGGLDRGDVVATAPLERRLLLLSDVPGIRARSTLAPGTGVGTSDLIVDIAPAPKISGDVEVDNAGNRYTGTYRFGGTVNLNDPTGSGDLLSLRLLGSDGGLGYGRLAYQAPLGNLTLGVAYTHLRYHLGREFDVLDADGTADILSSYASYPLVRSRDFNLYAQAGVDTKWLRDNVGLIDSRSRRTSTAGSLGFTGDSRDHSGWNNFSATVSVGDLTFTNPLERAADALSAHSGGGFSKVQASFSRLQSITGPFALYGSVRTQIAFDNLDSSEKMELGGAYGVRAYPEGEAYGDTGYVATAEARLGLSQWTRGLPGQFQLIGFIDVGEVEYSHDPYFVGTNHAHRSGIGGGVNWAGPHGFGAHVSYATRLGSEPVTSGPDRAGRVWFQLSKLF